MNKAPITLERTVERERGTIFPLAVMVGYLAFLICGSLPGGLSSVQGFFLGLASVILLYVVLLILASRPPQVSPSGKLYLHNLPDVSITQTENEREITIQISVHKRGALSQATTNG